MLICLFLAGCPSIVVKKYSLKFENTDDALEKITKISYYLTRSGFVSEYDPECHFDQPDLCKQNIHTKFFIPSDAMCGYDYFVSLTIQNNIIYITGIPPSGGSSRPVYFEEKITRFLSDNFSRDEYNIEVSKTLDPFR